MTEEERAALEAAKKYYWARTSEQRWRNSKRSREELRDATLSAYREMMDAVRETFPYPAPPWRREE